ncbi:MAG: hypothetical protein ACJ71Q_11155 [Terriglobales bacterium]
MRRPSPNLTHKFVRYTFRSIIFALSATLLIACGGGGGNTNTGGSSNNGGGNTPPPAVSVSVSPTSASVEIGATQQFAANVSNATNTAVSWQVNGTAGGNATVGTISANGLYTAPSAVPSPAQVTIAAVSQADTSKSGSASVTVQLHFTTQTLSGQYVFAMGGYDGTTTFKATGIFTADGNGNITTGIEDLINGTTVASAIPFSGTYTIDQNGVGTATIVTTNETTILAFAMESDKKTGDFIEHDTNANASGFFTKQDTSVSSSITGTYVFLVDGNENNLGPASIVGSITADGRGSLTGTEDLNEAGTFSPGVTFSGTYSLQPNGRGTASLTNAASVSSSFFLYVVDSNRVLFMESDGSTNFTGAARKQQGTFANASINGGYALEMSGPTTQSFVSSIGRFAADGAGGISGTLDSVNGVTPVPAQPFTGTYSVAANGRGTTTVTTSAGTSTIVFWMVDNTRIYLLFEDNDRVEDGVIRQQSGGPYSLASVSGSYVFGAEGVSNTGLFDVLGRLVADGKGNFSLSEQTNDTRTPGQFSSTGTYTLDSTGRGVVTVNGISGPLAVDLISPSEAYVQEMDATGTFGVVVKQF